MSELYRITEHPLWESMILPLLFIEIRCIACGEWMRPIRERKSTAPAWGTSLYLTFSCDQITRPGCSRGSKAGDEAQRILGLIHGWKDPRQPSLFER